MVGACLAPSVDRLVAAGRQIDLTLMKRVRRASAGTCARPRSGRTSSAARRPRRAPSSIVCWRAKAAWPVISSAGDFLGKHRHAADSLEQFLDRRDCETLCFADASNFRRAFRRESDEVPEPRCAAPPWSVWTGGDIESSRGIQTHSFCRLPPGFLSCTRTAWAMVQPGRIGSIRRKFGTQGIVRRSDCQGKRASTASGRLQ